MSFNELHPQLFTVIFHYLTQNELLGMLSRCKNRLIYSKIMDYIKQYITPPDEQQVSIKEMVKYECVISMYLIKDKELWKNVRMVDKAIYAACKFNKMPDIIRQYLHTNIEAGLKGAISGNNVKLINVIIMHLKKNDSRFYRQIIIERASVACNTVKTFNLLSDFCWFNTFNLMCRSCRENNTELIKHFSSLYKEDGKCAACFLSINSHLVCTTLCSDVCEENNKKRIKKYGDGKICDWCKKSVESHVASARYMQFACENNYLADIKQYNDGKVCGYCKKPVNKHLPNTQN